MWENHLEKIRSIEEEYGDNLNSPAKNEEIMKFALNVKEELKIVHIPEDYQRFLALVNGIDFNGLVIYGIDKSTISIENEEDNIGFIESNEIWYENEWQQNYVFFGDSDTAWYCMDKSNNSYFELDKPSGTKMNSFNNFNEMLESALKSRLY